MSNLPLESSLDFEFRRRAGMRHSGMGGGIQLCSQIIGIITAAITAAIAIAIAAGGGVMTPTVCMRVLGGQQRSARTATT